MRSNFKYGNSGRPVESSDHSRPGVSICVWSRACASVNCAKYSSTPQYCGGSWKRARTTSLPTPGGSAIRDSSKYCESSGIRHIAQSPLMPSFSTARPAVAISAPPLRARDLSSPDSSSVPASGAYQGGRRARLSQHLVPMQHHVKLAFEVGYFSYVHPDRRARRKTYRCCEVPEGPVTVRNPQPSSVEYRLALKLSPGAFVSQCIEKLNLTNGHADRGKHRGQLRRIHV